MSQKVITNNYRIILESPSGLLTSKEIESDSILKVLKIKLINMSWITISMLIIAYLFSGYKYINYEFKNKYKAIDKIMIIYLIPYCIIVVPIVLIFAFFTGQTKYL